MPVFKCTATFKQATGVGGTDTGVQRLAGWSESWYFDGSLAQAESAWITGGEAWCKYRAQLLPAQGIIVGERIQQVDPPGGTAVYGRQFPAGTTLTCDAPQVALLLRFPSSAGLNTKHWAMRDLPDARQEKGEYQPSQAFTDALTTFMLNTSTVFRFRAVRHDLLKSKIDFISEAGVVTTTKPHGLAVAMDVFISRTTIDISGRSKSFLRTVATVPSTTTFTTVGTWTAGSSQGGSVRQYLIGYLEMGLPSIERTVTKKVGRPSGEYRGRVSPRR